MKLSAEGQGQAHSRSNYSRYDRNHSSYHNRLWINESVFCVCTHHVADYETITTLNILARSDSKCSKCKECKGFVAYR